MTYKVILGFFLYIKVVTYQMISFLFSSIHLSLLGLWEFFSGRFVSFFTASPPSSGQGKRCMYFATLYLFHVFFLFLMMVLLVFLRMICFVNLDVMRISYTQYSSFELVFIGYFFCDIYSWRFYKKQFNYFIAIRNVNYLR